MKCRRTTRDPLLSILAKDGYTLLSDMRTGVDVLHAWVDFTGKGPFEPVGKLSALFDPRLPVLGHATSERPDIEAERTRAVQASVALKFLEPFFALIGAGFLARLRTNLEGMNGISMHVAVRKVTVKSISLADLAGELGTTEIATAQGRILTDGRRLAFAAQTVRAKTISIETRTKRGGAVNIGAGLHLVADVSTGASFTSDDRSLLSFSGRTPITFGVRLYELKLDAKRRVAQLVAPPHYETLDDADKRPGDAQAAAPLLIGGKTGSMVADL